MRVLQVFFGTTVEQLLLDLERILAGREPGAVRDAEDVRVDRDRRLPNATLRTTFAVLRPTPAASPALRACSAPCRRALDQKRDIATTFSPCRGRARSS
jgi:hypothetical protein